MGLATWAHVRPQVSGHRPGHTGCYSPLATLLASQVEKQANTRLGQSGLCTDQKGSAGRKKSPDHPADQSQQACGHWTECVGRKALKRWREEAVGRGSKKSPPLSGEDATAWEADHQGAAITPILSDFS